MYVEANGINNPFEKDNISTPKNKKNLTTDLAHIGAREHDENMKRRIDPLV